MDPLTFKTNSCLPRCQFYMTSCKYTRKEQEIELLYFNSVNFVEIGPKKRPVILRFYVNLKNLEGFSVLTSQLNSHNGLKPFR